MMKLGKRIAAYVCAAAMIVTSIPAATPVTAEAKVLSGLSTLGRQVAGEGGVLLENKDNVLPFAEGTTVSIFGRAQCHYDRYKSGLGSGGEVRVDGKDVVGIVDGLRNNSKINVNEDLAKIYADWVGEHPYQSSSVWKNHPRSQEEMPMTDEIAAEAAEKSDAAVIVISRTSGEDRDADFVEGSYLLTAAEKDMMRIVSENFDKVVVVLNVTNIIDMSWVEEYGIEGVLYSWNGGQNGGEAVADLLSGDVTPSGHLTDTIATDYTKYPSYENYGNGTDSKYGKNFYEEDIYVGYRYFETFAPDDVAYPFGYGLSYTTFDIDTKNVEVKDDDVKVTVTVKNTGNCVGKEVVQVYYGAPQAPVSKLGNPVKELAAFAKTNSLYPGETQNITLSFKVNDMASYDDSGVTGHESCYVLEAGDYIFYVGNNVRDAKAVDSYGQDETVVVEQLSEAAAPIEDFERYKAVEDGGEITLEKEAVPKLSVDVKEKIESQLPEELEVKDDNHYDLLDVYNGNVKMEEFVAQLSNLELAAIAQGSKQGANSVTNGCAGAFGGVEVPKDGKMTDLGKLYGIPIVSVADGPSGVRVSDYATLLPCGNAIGCSWNLELVEDLFELEGEELCLNNIDSLLGPGINIKRDPRCGRNFEYFAEDPLLTGVMAAAVAKGVQNNGSTVTVKHYAGNNQETARRNIDAVVSERALREIYLKGFEIYVKSGQGRSIMTSYNPVNGCWAASNYDLNTEILRNEWGYDGIVMTDWWGHMSKYAWADASIIEDRGDRYLATMVKAQNDIFMPVENIFGDNGSYNDKTNDVLDNISSGYLTRAELQRNAVNICNFIIKSQTFANYSGIEYRPYQEEYTDWFSVEQPNLGNPQVTGLKVDGRRITTFNQNVNEYRVFLPKNAALPKVEATVANGTTIKIEQATDTNRVAVIWATESQATKVYRVIFTDAKNMTPVLENPVVATVEDIKVNGQSIEGFETEVYDYSVAVDSLDTEPTIVAVTPNGVTAEVIYDEDTHVAQIVCVSKDQSKVYSLRLGETPKSDEFNTGELDSAIWTINNKNESNLVFDEEHLIIKTERGSNWGGQNDLKNQVVQSAYGDWEVEAKLDLTQFPNERYHSIGIAVMQDADNYVYSKVEYGGNVGLYFNQEKSGSNSSLEQLSAENTAKFTDVVYFKMKKLGNTYTASVSPDGTSYIPYYTTAYAEYDNPKFALYAGNGDQNVSSIEAAFDYVRFNTEDMSDTVAIGENTNIKVAEVSPAAMKGTISVQKCEDTDGGLNFTGADRGDYVVYNIDVEKTGLYDIKARMASGESDTQQVNFIVYADNNILFDFFRNGTGGEQVWVDVPGTRVKLTAGRHQLKIFFNTEGINLNWLQMDLSETLDDKKLTELETAIKDAKAVKVSGYTDASRKAFEDALSAAEKAFTNGTQTEIDNAMAALAAAKAGLTLPSDEKQENVEPAVKLIDQVKVAPKKSTLYVGGDKDKTTTIKVDVPQGAAIKSVTYNSSKTKYATVDKNTGKITAKKKGTTEITATVTLTNGESKDFKFKVAVKKAYIKASSVPKTIKKGKTKTLKAKAYGSSKKITWKITKGSKYAKITKKGKFTAKKKGTVKVTAVSGKIKKTFTIKVK